MHHQYLMQARHDDRLRTAAQHRLAAQARAAHRHDTQPALLPRLTRAWRRLAAA